jgi:putative MATE family efflux protein
MALYQSISIGATAHIAQAAGRWDRREAANLVAAALMLSVAVGLVATFVGYRFGPSYISTIVGNADATRFGETHLALFIPSLTLMFPTSALFATLRASGVFAPVMALQLLALLLKAALCPVLIDGLWGAPAMGVAGAAAASTIATIMLLVFAIALFKRACPIDLSAARLDRDAVGAWRKILVVGFPGNAETLQIFLRTMIVQWAFKDAGVTAQAAFGVSLRATQSVCLPALAVAFATPPFIGQAAGGGLWDRVASVYWRSLGATVGIMTGVVGATLFFRDQIIAEFTDDVDVARAAPSMLAVLSWALLPAALAYVNSAVFQGLARTDAVFWLSSGRFLLLATPLALWSSFGHPRPESIL